MGILNLFNKTKHEEEHRIYSCSIHDDVTILGQVFHGLDDIIAHVEMYMCDGSSGNPDKCKPEKKGKVHVGQLWMRYPCFDSSDYAYETRAYQNFILRDRPITSADMKKLNKLPWNGNAKRISESVPSDMLPMVYYIGDGDQMIIAV